MRNKISDRAARRQALEGQPCPECTETSVAAGRVTPDHGHCMRCGATVRVRSSVVGRRRRAATVQLARRGQRPVLVVVGP